MVVKTKKHKLEYKEKFDFLLIGLTSNENDYRLAWKLNNSLKYNFEKTENHQVRLSGGVEIEFPHFIFENQETMLFYRLLGNKNERGVLLEELKNIDFLLTVQGEFDELFISGFITNLKKIDTIHGVFRISPASLKNRERLLF